MRLRTAILLCLIFFTSIATITVGLNTSRLNIQKSFEKTILDSDPLFPGPLGGDPVGGGGGPH